MSKCSQIRITYSARGLPRFEVEVSHDKLNKYQLIKGDDQGVVSQKARAKMAEWDEAWAKRSEKELHNQTIDDKKKSASEKTEDAQNNFVLLDNLLKIAFDKDPTFNWDTLKNISPYPVPKPQPVSLVKPDPPKLDSEPRREWPKYAVKFGFIDNFSQSRRIKKEKEMEANFNKDHSEWESVKNLALNKYDEKLTQYENEKRNKELEYLKSVEKWENDKAEYLKKQDEANDEIEKQRILYDGGDADTVTDYCDFVLSASKYPDFFRNSYILNYNPENKLLLIDFSLPSPGVIPTLKEVRYVQSTDKFVESHITESQFNKLYDDVLYRITLRSIYEVFKADTPNFISSVVFNGYIKSISASTGKEINPCVLSLQANKQEFAEINLTNVEPKACFKQLKGVGSSRLYSMTAIAPIMKMDRSDKRFIASYDVEGGLNDAVNLALIDWEDFEHLVREVFEEEYGGPGNEVKVTRASRDGGVDAVAFDSDPIRGGKIIIQAKRYTNTVDVSAVRDLYGTVMNEGAMKGILVTTSDYGPDAYEFARNKPLSLMNGSNLLFLLEKHGHKAKIDLHEAKQILAQERADQNENTKH